MYALKSMKELVSVLHTFRGSAKIRKCICYLKIFLPHSGLVHRSQQWVFGLCLAVLEENQICESQTEIGSKSPKTHKCEHFLSRKILSKPVGVKHVVLAPPVALNKLCSLGGDGIYKNIYT